MALELARHGVPARIVERSPVPHRQARATALQPATLEIIERAGVLGDVLAASEHLAYARLFDADLQLVSEMSFAGAGSRYEFQASLPQYRTEQILTAHLEALGIAVERGVTASAVEAHDDRVVVGLTLADGTTQTVEADRVIGAGGARSITR